MAKKLETYEEKYKELEAIVKELDSEEMPLESMLEQYKKGLTLVKDCAEILNNTEAEVKQLIEEVRISDGTN